MDAPLSLKPDGRESEDPALERLVKLSLLLVAAAIVLRVVLSFSGWEMPFVVIAPRCCAAAAALVVTKS